MEFLFKNFKLKISFQPIFIKIPKLNMIRYHRKDNFNDSIFLLNAKSFGIYKMN